MPKLPNHYRESCVINYFLSYYNRLFTHICLFINTFDMIKPFFQKNQ